MIYSEDLIRVLKKNKISFFTGVPDSVLKNLSYYIDDYKEPFHKIAVNEGSAVGIGVGYYLSTKKIPCIYMQNSGLGNAINPIISIAHKKVYSIPLLLLIGWRGSPSSQDEPQHMIKGKITKQLLSLLGINFCVLESNKDFKKLSKLIAKSRSEKKIVACLIKNKCLKLKNRKKNNLRISYSLTREKFLNVLLRLIKKDSKIVSSTGHTSRGLMKIRSKSKLNKGKDFYMVGGMGHTNSVTLGMCLQSKKPIICLDGDGSLLMHLGSMFSNGIKKKSNFKHILLNNNSHESVGGQLTGAHKIDFNKLSKSLGYQNYFKITKEKEMSLILKKFLNNKKLSFLEVLLKSNIDQNLPRPGNLIEIKNNFMK